MILSRANLAVVNAASTDPRRRGLNSVHIATDGTTVASDGQVLIAVEPVNEAKAHFPLEGHVSPPAGGVCVDLNVIAQATRNIPRENRPVTQYAALVRCDTEVEFATTDLRETHKVSSPPIRDRFPDWQEHISEARKKSRVGKVCLDRKRLMSLLKILDAAAGEEDAIFLEIGAETDKVLIRTKNPETGQHVVAILSPLDTHGEWLRRNKWEKKIGKTE